MPATLIRNPYRTKLVWAYCPRCQTKVKTRRAWLRHPIGDLRRAKCGRCYMEGVRPSLEELPCS